MHMNRIRILGLVLIFPSLGSLSSIKLRKAADVVVWETGTTWRQQHRFFSRCLLLDHGSNPRFTRRNCNAEALDR
jgi:hypothetical protein